MAYNYFPNYQNPYFPNYPTQTPTPTMAQTQQNNGIVWVQGEAGAKSYMVAPGQSVMLMDSEANVFYIKSSDASGMPMPLRIFDYTERKSGETKISSPAPTPNMEDYVTKAELEERLAKMTKATKKEVKVNAESTI